VTLKAIFFDIGKTLVDDPFPNANHVVGEFLVSVGLLKQSTLGDFNDALVKANSTIDSYEYSHYWGERDILRVAFAKFGLFSDELIEQALRIYGTEVRRVYKTDGGLKALPDKELELLLRWLGHDLKMILGIISDERATNVSRYFEVLGCQAFFPIVVTSEEIGCRKPCPEIFQKALQRADVNSSSSMYIGDTLVRDIAGSRSVGMRPVWFTKFCIPNLETVNIHPDFVIDDLRLLSKIVPAVM
jgi:HAD superfamily hydrolase (TIGR01549 family)